VTLYFDTETRNDVPIAHGTDKYTRSCECIMATWAFDDEPVDIAPYLSTWGQIALPDRVLDYLQRGSLSDIIVAHGAKFDFGVVTYALGFETDIRRWRCTQAQAYAHGLPGSLELLGAVLGLSPEDAKLAAEGQRLIQTFCVPGPGTSVGPHDVRYFGPEDRPDDWRLFCDYGIRDTHALRLIHRKLPVHNYRGEGLEWAFLDTLVNWRGFRFDKSLALAARHILELAKGQHAATIHAATDGAVGAVTQRKRLLDYLNLRYGAELSNLRSSTIRDMLDQDDLDPGLRFLLQARLEGAKSSGAKYGRGLTLLGPQERLRHCHQVFGAGRTQRDSHKGFQPGNLPRPTMDQEYISEIVIPGILNGAALDEPLIYGGANTACANALRGTIVAAPGNELIDADFSNIESRVTAWISRQFDLLALYLEGADLYKLWYSENLGVPIEEVTYWQRQMAKVVYLAFSFGGGVGAIATMAAQHGLDLDEFPDMIIPKFDEKHVAKATRLWERAALIGEDWGLEPRTYIACDLLKQAFRESNDRINQTRYDLDKALREAIRTPGVAHEVARCRVWATASALLIQLPDGSRLTYLAPRIHRTVERDPITGKEHVTEHTSFMTARGMSWRREKAWAGVYFENIVQAIANRMMRTAALRIHKDTLTVPAIAAYLARLPAHARTAIVLRWHDSITLDVPKGSYPLERMLQQMTVKNEWATDFPVKAEGWTNERYGKH
jgi:DNA polymerase